MTFRSSSLVQALLLLVTVFTSSSRNVVSGASYGSCNSTGGEFFCPTLCEEGGYVSDCFSCDGYMSSDEEHNICIDRRLFQPVNTDPNNYDDHYHYLWNDLVGAIVWFLTAGISIACGVGGGGIYVPLGIMIFKFAPKQSSGFSQASIFGAALAGLIINSRSHHPVTNIRHDAGHPDKSGRPLAKQADISKTQQEEYVANGGKLYTRPMVNYDMALFMSPMQMAGAVLGVMVQKVLPNWLYLLTAGVVLAYISYKTYKKWYASRQVEQQKKRAATEQERLEKEQQEANQQTPASMEEEKPAINGHDNEDNQTGASMEESGSLHDTNDGQQAAVSTLDKVKLLEEGINNPQPQICTIDDDNHKLELRKQYLEKDMRQYPMEKIGALFLLWIGLFVLTLFLGGKGVESIVGITCDSPWYYVVIAIQFMWLFCFAAYFGHQLLNDQRVRMKVDYPYLGEEDPVWDAPSIRFYGVFCFISGVVAALIGIGGGMVLGPLMLIMGVDPQVSTSTNSTMIVITSSSIAIMFVTSGLVPWGYALFYFCVTFVGAFIGKIKIDSYVKRTGRASILIFILASIIAFATIGSFVIFITRLSAKDWCFDDFQPFCSVGKGEDCPVSQMFMATFGPTADSVASRTGFESLVAPSAEWSP